jgi:zinc/manganese transport system permease protein
MARPLLLTSVDPRVARALGVPVRALGVAFLVVLGAVAAEATQAVGALLLLGLLAAPAGAARLLSDRPWRGLALAAAIAVGSMWSGLALSYEIDSLPAGTAVVSVATGAFLLAGAWSWARERGPRRARGGGPIAPGALAATSRIEG